MIANVDRFSAKMSCDEGSCDSLPSSQHHKRDHSITPMDALDGNAIAGQLFEQFGSEMTTARGRCAHCGTEALIAELRGYTKAQATECAVEPAEMS